MNFIVNKLYFIIIINISFAFIGIQGESDLTESELKCITSCNCPVAEEICPNKDIRFFLYTRDTQHMPYELKVSNESSIKEANFLKARPIVILIHGYTGDRDFDPNSDIRPAYFQHDDYNVISLDYGPLVPEPCYFQSVANLKVVSNCTAQLIDNLVTNVNVPLEQFHVIGFSLGAHVAGMLSQYLKSGKLKRITGLDPAKPLFITATEPNRLDAGDAEFVDILHTNIVNRGLFFPLGHVDFYANGGLLQPGCNNATSTGSCNHARAPMYYAESINSKKGFWGFYCDNYFLYLLGVCYKTDNNQMIFGINTPSSARGLYFFTTNSQKPFAQGRLNASKNIRKL